MTSDTARAALHGDCSACAGLCCVQPAFSRSSEFGHDKAPNTPCHNLQGDHRCGIHADLLDEGYRGCVVYDCFGAGQAVTRHHASITDRLQAFPAARHLHELLWHVKTALMFQGLPPLLLSELQDAERLVSSSLLAPAAAVPALHARANAVLVAVSGAVRAGQPAALLDLRGADRVGADLRGSELRGANLRGALLLGADLRGVDLSFADVTGADFRGAHVHGAHLAQALWLTPVQVAAAVGDETTTLPTGVRPRSWSAVVALGRPQRRPPALPS
jgi:hypothetical protein